MPDQAFITTSQLAKKRALPCERGRPSEATWWWEAALPDWCPPISKPVFKQALASLVIDAKSSFSWCCSFPGAVQADDPALSDYLVTICIFCEKYLKPADAVDCPCEHHRSDQYAVINTIAAFVKLFRYVFSYDEFKKRVPDHESLGIFELGPATFVRAFEDTLCRESIDQLRASLTYQVGKTQRPGVGSKRSAREADEKSKSGPDSAAQASSSISKKERPRSPLFFPQSPTPSPPPPETPANVSMTTTKAAPPAGPTASAKHVLPQKRQAASHGRHDDPEKHRSAEKKTKTQPSAPVDEAKQNVRTSAATSAAARARARARAAQRNARLNASPSYLSSLSPRYVATATNI